MGPWLEAGKVSGFQTESMNGRVGTIVEYSYVPHSDRFAVKLERSGKEVAIRACNLSLVNHNVTTQHTSSTGATHQQAGTTEITTSTSSEQQRQRELETALLHPGALFVGTIQIPGLSEDEGRKEYSMTVAADPIQDEMGQPTGILARHRAYEDEQFVWIHLDHDDDGGGGGGGGGSSSQATSCLLIIQTEKCNARASGMPQKVALKGLFIN